MPFLTRWFGVTDGEIERDIPAESACTREIVERVLAMQADAAAGQQRPLCRGTHAKGVSLRAQFEVFDVAEGRDPALATRLARGVFSRPGVFAATVRFANSDPHVNSDLKPDVRSLSIAVDLAEDDRATPTYGASRQDFSMQNASTLPLNDARAFLATMQVITAKTPLRGFWALSFADQRRVLRAVSIAQFQSRQPLRPYQALRYWSTVPFSHGPSEVVMQS